MPDRPPDNPGPPSGDPERSLNDILAALSRVGEDPVPGDAGPMHGAVEELRGALDRLFELVRTERAEQRGRIAELEAALSVAHARIRALEAGEDVPIPAPPPNDFGQLREAAERLRQRTEELFRDAAPGAAGRDDPAGDDDAEHDGAHGDPAQEPDGDRASEALDEPDEAAARLQKARDAVAASLAEEAAAARGEERRDDQDEDDLGDGTQAPEADDRADATAGFGTPGVLRIFPGSGGPSDPPIDVENDLDVDAAALDDEEPEPVAVAAALPAAPAGSDEPAEAEEQAAAEASTAAADPSDESGSAAPDGPELRPEPIEVPPRPARKRRAGLRRRRIDARKLTSVDPATALRAMVSAIDDIWTAGVTLDLVVALTDGGALKVSGGHNRPLSVVAVKPGTPARTTVTATTAQLVPLFGRLELTGEQSPPMIHGPRRDADVLVGWIDRAQRLEPQPL